jgi:uroporphyrinogen-III decarboxylase
MGSTSADVIGLDWATDIKVARQTLGQDVPVQGNLDPMVLFGPEEVGASLLQGGCVALKHCNYPLFTYF